MGRFCMRRGGGGKAAKTIGLALMATGLVLLLVSVPSWMWASILGMLLISIGFLIWRFC